MSSEETTNSQNNNQPQRNIRRPNLQNIITENNTDNDSYQDNNKSKYEKILSPKYKNRHI